MVGVVLETPPPVEHMLGMEVVDDFIRRLGGGGSFRDLLARAKSAVVEPPFHNTLLSGAKGTGKTTRAKILAFKYREIGLVKKDAVIGFIEVSKITGEHVGNSEKAFKNFINGKGIVILDELHSMLDVYSYGKNILNYINVHMGNNINAPIFIATCYETRREELLSNPMALARRFRHVFLSPEFADNDLISIFVKKVEATDMFCGPGVVDAVRELLMEVERAQGKKFGNVGEVKNIFDTAVEIHGANLIADGIKVNSSIFEDRNSPAFKKIMTLTLSDLPVFDKSSGSYLAAFGAAARPTYIPTSSPVRRPEETGG